MDNLPSVTAHELQRMVLDVLKLPESAQEIFSLWLVSPFLGVQLKPKHQPYKICRQWQELLLRFTSCPVDEIVEDEPSLQFRRNIFFLRRKELQIQDEDVLRLLYEEAKHNVLEGRFPCDPADCDALGALVCRINLGPYHPEQHTASFLKEKLDCFLPSHLCHRGHKLFSSLRKRTGSRPPVSEQGLLRAFREVPEAGACEEHATLLRLYHAYLQKCHELPYYGCAFFFGEIDKPVQGLLHRAGRKAVTVAISLEGVYVMDTKEKYVLLGLRFQQLSWDHTVPNEEEPILWLEFDGENEGQQVNKLLKVYSKQVCVCWGSYLNFNGCVCVSHSNLHYNYRIFQSPATASVPTSDQQPPKIQRQSSVLCSRIQRLATIDYVEEGKEIKRVKPRRTTSFFGRQLSNAPTSYSAVRAAENLEQG
ncbi:PREDICTED: FERM domain-containing protein 8 [Thamnophis sirtalis]|uniref:FERM domain-containing protein 8 n=1 Tax=Thamnophis sirtalis TaxID=35019 RepID=A0A6I9XY01_9SAUR|nr:PREDICTED: FERM domain-containing protein 8 [Thamnophis sirtalis]